MILFLRLGLWSFAVLWVPIAAAVVAHGATPMTFPGAVSPAGFALLAALVIGRAAKLRSISNALARQRGTRVVEGAHA